MTSFLLIKKTSKMNHFFCAVASRNCLYLTFLRGFCHELYELKCTVGEYYLIGIGCWSECVSVRQRKILRGCKSFGLVVVCVLENYIILVVCNLCKSGKSNGICEWMRCVCLFIGLASVLYVYFITMHVFHYLDCWGFSFQWHYVYCGN